MSLISSRYKTLNLIWNFKPDVELSTLYETLNLIWNFKPDLKFHINLISDFKPGMIFHIDLIWNLKPDMRDHINLIWEFQPDMNLISIWYGTLNLIWNFKPEMRLISIWYGTLNLIWNFKPDIKRFPPGENIGGDKMPAEKTPWPASRPPEAWIWAQMLVFARVSKLFHHFRGAEQPSQARAWPGQPGPRDGPQNCQNHSLYQGFLAFS